MVFSYNWLQSFLKKKLPEPEKLAELLTMHSFEAGEVKKSGRVCILDIDVLPNRGPDCFSHLGISREISAITGLNLREPFSEVGEEKKIKAKDFVSVEVRNRIACPRYTARVVTGVRVRSSPAWIQDRLKACGLRPINNVVDIANYVMLETGQPLHAFDFEKISGIQNKKLKSSTDPHSKNQKHKLKIKNIIIRKARKREKITTLDGERYDLDNAVLIIADSKEPLAIAGIKGGKKAEIDKNTKTVILESANFDPRVIRQGSKSLELKTDASIRFEHGLDPNLTEFAINRAAYLIQEITGGKVAWGLVDVYPKKVLPKRIRLDLEYLNSLLGITIPKTEVKRILTSLGFQCEEKRHPYIEVDLPTRRLDISLPEDLIEEVARIYGYQKIPTIFPKTVLAPPERNLNFHWGEISKDILKEAGLTEVYSYSFFGKNEANLFGYTKKDLIEVENPLSQEQKYLRASLIPNLLKNVEKNLRYTNQIQVFELGRIFRSGKAGEKRMLAGAFTGNAFYWAKGVIDSLLNGMGIGNVWYDDYQPTPEESKISVWHPKKCSEIKTDHTEIGFLGEISSRILSKFEIPLKVVMFDLDFQILQKLASEEHEYQPISRYPEVVRDLAVLVPKETKVANILNKINAVGGPLVRDVDLFDIYEGEELPSDKKNLAFHIIYQSDQKTLKSDEVDEVQKRIIKALEENPEWQVRR